MIMGLEEEERTRDRLASSVSVLTEAMNEGSVRQGEGAFRLSSTRTSSAESALLRVVVESVCNAE